MKKARNAEKARMIVEGGCVVVDTRIKGTSLVSKFRQHKRRRQIKCLECILSGGQDFTTFSKMKEAVGTLVELGPLPTLPIERWGTVERSPLGTLQYNGVDIGSSCSPDFKELIVKDIDDLDDRFGRVGFNARYGFDAIYGGNAIMMNRGIDCIVEILV